MYRKFFKYITFLILLVYVGLFAYNTIFRVDGPVFEILQILPAAIVILTGYVFLIHSNKDSNRTIDQMHDEYEEKLRELSNEIIFKDKVLDQEKEKIKGHYNKLKQTLDKQKDIIAANDEIKSHFEKVISINRYIWFMDNQDEILDEICQNSIETIGAVRAAIFIDDINGDLKSFGTSICSTEEKLAIESLLNKPSFIPTLTEKLRKDYYATISKREMPENVGKFIGDNAIDQYLMFPIYFREILRGVAIYNREMFTDISNQDISIITMFISIISVYFERNELLCKEKNLTDVISEKEKMVSISNLIQGLTHNINSPLNTVIMTHDIIMASISKLKDKYPDEPALEKLKKTTSRVKKAGESINQIMSNLTKKSMLDSKAEPDFYSCNELVENEVTFLNADMNFKHKFEKDYDFGENLPPFFALYRDCSYFFESIVYMVMHVLSDRYEKMLKIKTENEQQSVAICIDIPTQIDTAWLNGVVNGSVEVNIDNMNQIVLQQVFEKSELKCQFIGGENSTTIKILLPISA